MSLLLLNAFDVTCQFWFRKTRSKEGSNEGVVQVNIYYRPISKREVFGPVSSEIRTTRDCWDRRNEPIKKTPNRELPNGQKVYDPNLDPLARLKKQLDEYEKNFELARIEFYSRRRQYTPEALHTVTMAMVKRDAALLQEKIHGEQSVSYRIAASYWEQKINALVGMQTRPLDRTLLMVHEEFIKVQEKFVNDNQFTRTPGQIGASTFTGYVNHFNPIKAYLKATNQEDVLITHITPGFVDRLQEWLMTQNSPKTKRQYQIGSINMFVQTLRAVCRFAVRREYIQYDPTAAIRHWSAPKSVAKPLPPDILHILKTAELPEHMRWMIDSWLVAMYLNLHYADYMNLPKMEIRTFNGLGVRYIDHPRKKQRGTALRLVSHLTPEVEEILAKYGGPHKLYYRTLGAFIKGFEQVCELLDLRNGNGSRFHIQFGMARDTGMSMGAAEGRSAEVLKNNAGHSNVSMQSKYINAAPSILEEHLKRQVSVSNSKIIPLQSNAA
ncbi:phage integrase SAM-like domain-containing protein [Larkinella insperata]|uniref:Phage integrase SAM-like domain-containing protein n=1 Tax=Larkinella insperata TaxID=332158 RepID=A0ABW3Q8X9_9BACT|nr:phage integrase SAM-like domain-containing protein [Larkinella insperata]